MTIMKCAGNVTLLAFVSLSLAPLELHAARQTGQARLQARIDSATMLADVRVLSHDSLGGRATGTEGGAKAREYMRKRFVDAGLVPFGPGHLSEFSMRPGRDGAPVAPGYNVLGMIRGTVNPTRYIVVSAHYDHLPPRSGEIMNGADDNASGSAALLALAGYFSRNPPATSIVFAAFDAEERGLVGATAFVANPPVPRDSIIMNVNMDMVGRNDRNELYVTGTLAYPQLKPFVERVQPGASVKLLMGHDRVEPGGRGSDNWTSASDHGAFHRANIPFLYFGVEDHPDYHQHTDEFERLQPGFYVRAVETVLDAVLLLDANARLIAVHKQ
jgi:hypothetical protein